MALAPHMWRFLGLGRMRVTVEFHPPVTVQDMSSRKALAQHCARAVAAGVARAIAGQPAPAPAGAAGAGRSAVDSAPRRDASVAS
jgi:1-acyl-sn-glycerol-3-phosphate acyltransferase